MVAAERAQALELAFRLDALGNDAHTERAGHADDRLDDRAVAVAVLAQAHDERAVDLQAVERIALQVAQRRVAGAEVIEQQPDAECLQQLDRERGRGPLLKQQPLGDLEAERVGVQTGLGGRPGW